MTISLRRVALILLPFALGATYLVFHGSTPPAEEPYPEFLSIPADEFERARRAIPPDVDRGTMEHWDWFKKYDADASLAECRPLAVLAALHERACGPARIPMYGPCYDDDRRIPVGHWLSRHADASLNGVLVRLVEDREMPFELRDIATVALCREGNGGVLAALIEFVVDNDRSETLRTRILHRLPRIGARLGPEIEALLSFPYRGLDDIAAAALVLTGDPIAPSLLRDALADLSWSPGDREHLLVRAAAALADDDPELAAQAAVALDLIQEDQRGGPSPRPPPPDQAILNTAASFARWLDAHPEVRTSTFEREREAYRASDRYRREQATLASEEPWRLEDEDFDLAAALVRVDPKHPERRARWLDALDRMAVFLRREVGDRADPNEVLGVLHHHVLSAELRSEAYAPDLPGPPSYLERVLSLRSGNCVGWSSVYLALADRLELPLVPVATPNHVFVRWDDGGNVLDVELTAMGLLRPTGIRGREEPVVITRRGVVAKLYVNRSYTWRTHGLVKDEDRYEKALLYADRAIAWAPDCLDGHVARVQALTTLGDPAAAARAAEEAIAAFDADPASADGLTTAGDVLLSAGDATAALDWFDRAFAIDPSNGDILRRRLCCLENLDRDGDLIREASEFLAGNDHRGVRLLRLGALARTGDARWRRELAELEGEGPTRWLVRMSLAETLLEQDRWRDATETLDGLSDLCDAAAEARKRADRMEERTPTNDEIQRYVSDAILLEHWYRSQRIRARALDLAGKSEEAQALRETIHR